MRKNETRPEIPSERKTLRLSNPVMKLTKPQITEECNKTFPIVLKGITYFRLTPSTLAEM